MTALLTQHNIVETEIKLFAPLIEEDISKYSPEIIISTRLCIALPYCICLVFYDNRQL